MIGENVTWEVDCGLAWGVKRETLPNGEEFVAVVHEGYNFLRNAPFDYKFILELDMEREYVAAYRNAIMGGCWIPPIMGGTLHS